MRWHIELLLETALLAILWYRNAPRWFSILIGTDCAGQLLQIIFYRAGYVEFGRLFWRGDVLAVALCRMLALIELHTLDRTLRHWRHACILAFWASAMTVLSLFQVAQPNAVIFKVNNAILIVQTICFSAWILLFIGSAESRKETGLLSRAAGL